MRSPSLTSHNLVSMPLPAILIPHTQLFEILVRSLLVRRRSILLKFQSPAVTFAHVPAPSLSCSPFLSSSHHSYVGCTSPKHLQPGVLSARSRLTYRVAAVHHGHLPVSRISSHDSTALSPPHTSLPSMIFILRRDVSLLFILDPTRALRLRPFNRTHFRSVDAYGRLANLQVP